MRYVWGCKKYIKMLFEIPEGKRTRETTLCSQHYNDIVLEEIRGEYKNWIQLAQDSTESRRLL
jgi:hypothetical protein